MSAPAELIPAGEFTPEERAERINGLLDQHKDGLRISVETAWCIGGELLSVKEALPHGEFEAWCEGNLSIKKVQRARWMKLAKVYPTTLSIEAPSIDAALGYLKAPSVHHTSKTAEHYTPDIVLELVIRAMGDIDLDPCADPDCQVPAKTHFTAEDDGLSQLWEGRVFMNPPYGAAISEWVEHLTMEFATRRVRQFIALVPARTDTEWWNTLTNKALVCFVRGRLTFKGNDNPAPFPSALCYRGERGGSFKDEFSALGAIWSRCE